MTTITVLNPAKLSVSATANVSSLAAARAQKAAVRAEGRRHKRLESRRRMRNSVKMRLTKRGKIVFSLLGMIIALVLTTTASVLFAPHASADFKSESSVKVANSFGYVVPMQGDTLWSIAHRLAPNEDPRNVISDIQRLNQLHGSTLDAYTPLAVPERLKNSPEVVSAAEAGVRH